MKARSRRALLRGFSLLEMAMVLVIVGVVMGAVTVGSDVMRQAKAQQAYSVFVAGWRDAFAEFARVSSGVPRDSTPPSNLINGGLFPAPFTSPPPLCALTLVNEMLGASVRVPQGRGSIQQTEYLYQDSNGAPHVLTVCFQTLVALPGGIAGVPEQGWAVLDRVTALGASFKNVNRHVMVIRGLTIELALQMDALIDGTVNPQMGQFRWRDLSNILVDNPNARWGNVRTDMASGESAHVEVIAYFEMF